MAFKRTFSKAEVKILRGKTLLGLASAEEQFRLLGHMDLIEIQLREALEYFLSHTKLNTRWPCPECGRPDAAHKLVTIEVQLFNGQRQIVGCHTCNMDPVIGAAERALEFPG